MQEERYPSAFLFFIFLSCNKIYLSNCFLYSSVPLCLELVKFMSEGLQSQRTWGCYVLMTFPAYLPHWSSIRGNILLLVICIWRRPSFLHPWTGRYWVSRTFRCEHGLSSPLLFAQTGCCRQGLEGQGKLCAATPLPRIHFPTPAFPKNPVLTLAHPEHPLTPALSHPALISVHCNDLLTVHLPHPTGCCWKAKADSSLLA